MELQPFEKIITSNKNALRYDYWYSGACKINIANIIQTTHEEFENDVTQKDFDKMITTITNGSKSSSALVSRRDPNIIKNICILFPKYLTTKNVDNIIKCVSPSIYPEVVTDIASTGYEFKESQIKVLNNAGYNMASHCKKMSYTEFLSLFDNDYFFNELRDILMIDCFKSSEKLNPMIQKLNDLREKFKFEVKTDFITYIMNKKIEVYEKNRIDIIVNLHVLAKELGVKIDEQHMRDFVINHSASLSINMVYDTKMDNNVILYSNVNDKKFYEKFRKLLDLYDDTFMIDREMLICCIQNETKKYKSVNSVINIVHPSLTNYDPVEDIFYILYVLERSHEYAPPLCIKHLLHFGYLRYDDFILLLISLGFTNNGASVSFDNANVVDMDIFKNYLKKNNQSIDPNYVDNFFTFCNSYILDILSEYKILPTYERIMCCTYESQIQNMVENSFFLEDITEEYINNIIQNKCYDKDYDELSVPFVQSRGAFLKIYNSLTERDQKILERLDINLMFLPENIIRYDIYLTTEYVQQMLLHGYWKTIVCLLHLSDTYKYLLELIDINMVITINSYIGRLWFMNNIFEGKRDNFVVNSRFFDIKLNVERDVTKLLSKPIVNDPIMIQKMLSEEKNKKKTEHAESKFVQDTPIFNSEQYNIMVKPTKPNNKYYNDYGDGDSDDGDSDDGDGGDGGDVVYQKNYL